MDKLDNQKYTDQGFLNEDEIDIKEIWRIIYSYRKSVVLIFVAVVSLTIYLTLTSRPIYQATTVVMIKESGTDPVLMSLILG